MRLRVFILRLIPLFLLAELLARVLPVPNFAPSEFRKRSIPFRRSYFGSHIVEPSEDGKPRMVKASFYGSVDYPLNSQGFRGPEFREKKEPGTIRIAMLGASGLFDLAASGYEDWPSIVGRRLSERLKRPVEVMNFGVPGAIVINCALRITTSLYRYHPDYFVLFDSWMELKYFHIRKPLYEVTLESGRNLFTRPSFAFEEELAEHSRVFAFARAFYLRHFYYRSEGFDNNGNVWAGKWPVEDEEVTGKLDEPTPIALDEYGQALRAFVNASRDAGAQPIFISEPTILTANVDPGALGNLNKTFYHHFSRHGLIRGLEEEHRVLTEVAKEKNVRLFDFDAEMNGRPEFFLDHVHVTPAGRAVLVARTVDQFADVLAQNRPGSAKARRRRSALAPEK